MCHHFIPPESSLQRTETSIGSSSERSSTGEISMFLKAPNSDLDHCWGIFQDADHVSGKPETTILYRGWVLNTKTKKTQRVWMWVELWWGSSWEAEVEEKQDLKERNRTPAEHLTTLITFNRKPEKHPDLAVIFNPRPALVSVLQGFLTESLSTPQTRWR